MHPLIAGLALALLAAPITAHAQGAARPDIAKCPNRQLTGDEGTGRTKAIPVPRQVGAIVRANRDNFAVLTLGGKTLCVDSSWMSQASKFTLSPDGRFLSFDWVGYEAFGNIVVDRSGNGQIVDTGVAPVFSPSRSRLAAADLSESAFGALNAFAVWQVERQGLRQIAKLENLPSMSDWRVDSWQGETCVNLSAIPFDRLPSDQRQLARTRRDRFVAKPGRNGWSVTPAKAGCPRQ